MLVSTVTSISSVVPCRMLVYEYVENGNLDQWLHGDVGEVSPLTWEIRMGIIIGTAKGYGIFKTVTPLVHWPVLTRFYTLSFAHNYFSPASRKNSSLHFHVNLLNSHVFNLLM